MTTGENVGNTFWLADDLCLLWVFVVSEKDPSTTEQIFSLVRFKENFISFYLDVIFQTTISVSEIDRV